MYLLVFIINVISYNIIIHICYIIALIQLPIVTNITFAVIIEYKKNKININV